MKDPVKSIESDLLNLCVKAVQIVRSNHLEADLDTDDLIDSMGLHWSRLKNPALDDVENAVLLLQMKEPYNSTLSALLEEYYGEVQMYVTGT